MRWALIAVLLFLCPLANAVQFGLGGALEYRFQREVNPDYADVKSLGLLDMKFKFINWAALVEFGNEAQSSSSGALATRSETQSIGIWGRYEFFAQPSWAPYLASGIGGYYDMVRTTLNTDVSEKVGSRVFLGFGTGVTRTFFEHVTADLEGRALFVEDRKDPYLSGLLRLIWEI